MKQETCLCTRNVLFESFHLEFLSHVKVCAAYPSYSKCPNIRAPVNGLAKMLAVLYKKLIFISLYLLTFSNLLSRSFLPVK